MSRTILVLAFAGAVLVMYVAHVYVPNTPIGEAIVLVAYGAAVYPVFRASGIVRAAPWRYAMWLGAGAALVGVLEVWRRSLAPSTSLAIGQAVGGLATACVAGAAWQAHRRRKTRPR